MRLCTLLCQSIGPSVHRSVRLSHLTFHCSCLSDQVSANTAPAHPNATGVAVYPALFILVAPKHLCKLVALSVSQSFCWSVGQKGKYLMFTCPFIFSRGNATLHLAMSVSRSVGRSVHPSDTFLNSERFLHYCPCPTVRDCLAV